MKQLRTHCAQIHLIELTWRRAWEKVVLKIPIAYTFTYGQAPWWGIPLAHPFPPFSSSCLLVLLYHLSPSWEPEPDEPASNYVGDKYKWKRKSNKQGEGEKGREGGPRGLPSHQGVSCTVYYGLGLEIVHIQLTPDSWNLQGKSRRVWVSRSSSYRGMATNDKKLENTVVCI